MTTDQQLRFECLKIAAAIEPREDPRPAAEKLISFVCGDGARSMAGSADRRTASIVSTEETDRYSKSYLEGLSDPLQKRCAAFDIAVRWDGHRVIWSSRGVEMKRDEIEAFLAGRSPFQSQPDRGDVAMEPGVASSIGVLDISGAEVRLRCFALTSSDQPFSKRISDAMRYATFALAAGDGGREDRVACLEALVSDEDFAIDDDLASKIIDRATALALFVEAKADA